ncbi:hypothetical protein Acid345_3360 [Candidatus Koribacter versatilis Ellin345]|uniref:FecR protein domain-containing protein n=1 Tax=Koribacter versatilis (strain Ellin345) TaxID=204669 RepID=Q1IL89_KORVE|nr:FecR family protein [Candidatus Koribacter versatilis]ABF42361.1 hypothetical protein Acid345_3360 [Candidatus Koribacter versatilis Ellin345]
MLQRRKGLLIALLAVVCSFVLLLPALAESNVRIVRLSYIDGDAQINTTNQDDGFTHAVLNTPVTAGMWIYTPNNSHAEIQFENGSTVRMVDDAQIQFEKLALADSGGKINIINVDHGVVYFNFSKVGKDDNIIVKAGAKTIHVAKSSHFRVDASDKNVLVSVFKGDAMVDGDQSIEIKNNESVNLAAEDAKVGRGVDELGSDTWDKHRDGEVAALSMKAAPVGYGDAYSSQFGYLGSYGNYTNVPGFGWGWQPYGMGMGWDPFMNGVWNYNPGLGYMWVSSYPWGWGPYRYGAWNYVPAYGWMWMPGSSFNSWNVGPAYGAVPANWHAPTVPVVGKTPVKTVVVGNPPNVHPAILAGHPEGGSHAAVSTRAKASNNVRVKPPVATATSGAKPTSNTTATKTGTSTGAKSGAQPAHAGGAQHASGGQPSGQHMGGPPTGGGQRMGGGAPAGGHPPATRPH